MPISTKLERMMTSIDELLPVISHDPLITWPGEIRGLPTGGGSARKHLNHHRLRVPFVLDTVTKLVTETYTSAK